MAGFGGGLTATGGAGLTPLPLAPGMPALGNLGGASGAPTLDGCAITIAGIKLMISSCDLNFM
jgi:hypothetical protein